MTASWRVTLLLIVTLFLGPLFQPFGSAVAFGVKKPVSTYYLSLGDSSAEGYQPGYPTGSETLHGFSNRVVIDLQHYKRLTLENFACGGETSGQMFTQHGCAPENLALDAAKYGGQTQLAAALAFVAAHRHHVGLITISLGVNDLWLGNSVATMQANLQQIVAELRSAAGPLVPIIGLNIDDYQLADWLNGPTGQSAAVGSVPPYVATIDPAFAAVYTGPRVGLVNVAKAFDTFVPFTTVTYLAPYGSIPTAVAGLCRYTWNCAQNNEHLNSVGYALVASMIASTYVTLTR